MLAARARATTRAIDARASRASAPSAPRVARRAAARATKLTMGPAGRPVPNGYGDYYPAPRDDRRAGVIMHPTSLPGAYGIGDAGPEARAFVDWMAKGKMSIWQVLPLVPPGRPIPGVREDYWSPYSGRDAHCGNTLVISLDDLVADGLLETKDLPKAYGGSENVDFGRVAATNEPLIAKAAEKLLAMASGSGLKGEYDAFCARADVKAWLDPAATFDAIDSTPELLGKYWWDWPAEYRDRDPGALAAIESEKSELD